MARIGVIGYGFVGKAVVHGFEHEENEILYYDKFLPSSPLKEVAEKSDFIFVCVPSPFKDDKIDLSIMNEVIEELSQYASDNEKLLIIKSTVVPGTTKHYAEKYPQCRFLMNPEFLTEKNYLHDFIHADRMVIGATNPEDGELLAQLYRDHLPPTPIFITDTTSAEMVKYMANCFLATKVIFGNEMYDLCQHLNINYDTVREMVAADVRIGPSHFTVTPERGFGEKCFPKDLIALMGLYKELGIDASLLKTVWEKNIRIRSHKDWEQIPFVKG